VLFDKICRLNGITHRLTQPASPTTTGKIERFHLTLRRELLDDCGPFTSLEAAQAAMDEFVQAYNTDRPHQGLDSEQPVTPADRFAAIPAAQQELLPVWLPPTLTAAPAVSADPVSDSLDDGADSSADGSPAGSPWAGGPVEFDRIVPASGNMAVAGRQFWLGPIRSSQTVRFWASVEVIHLMIGGVRIKSVRSHLTTADLAVLAAAGAVNAGPPPLPVEDGEAVEIERTVSRGGTIAIGGTVLLAAEILAGRRIGIRIEPGTLMMFDLDSRELLRVRPNPLNYAKIIRLRGARPAGPPPRPSIEPVRAQRRASNSGVIMICGQKIALGRVHAHRTVTVHVSETTLAIELADGDTRVVRRTTTQPVRNIKANRPRPAKPQII
jgi:hypothetical protein